VALGGVACACCADCCRSVVQLQALFSTPLKSRRAWCTRTFYISKSTTQYQFSLQ
jgi:hypothetical protein